MKTENAKVVDLRWNPTKLCLIQGVKGKYVPPGVYGGSNGSFIAPASKSELNLILMGEESDHIYKFDISSAVRKVFDKKNISKQLRENLRENLIGKEFIVENGLKLKDFDEFLKKI